MSRIVVVSNRVAVARDAGKTRARAGGLAVALEAALRESGGLWFGWSGETTQNRPRAPKVTTTGQVSYATLDLTRAERAEYYNGFANQTLWPLFHYRMDLTAYERGQERGYIEVNRLFARHLARLLRPDDLVWVHDFHLLPMGQELRRLGARYPIGFFLHTPFPPPEILLTLPNHEAIVRSLFAYDLAGFQTPDDLRAFHGYVTREAGGEVRRNSVVSAFGRTIRTQAFPISIDAGEFAGMAESRPAKREYERTRVSMRGRKLILGVDRLDYSKGLREKFLAFERFLDRREESRGKVVLMQVAPPSRGDVAQYREIRKDLEQLTGHINGRFSEPDWVPIWYLNRSFPRANLAGLYRASHVALVTPFRDGMNLVAKEFVAAQSPDDPGVLVVSRFAGAARELRDALVVNPHDTDGVANAIHRALNMRRKERIERWSSMMGVLEDNDLTAWRHGYVRALRRTARDGLNAPA